MAKNTSAFQLTGHGYEFRTPYAVGVFSFGNLSWELLPQHYPQFSFDRVKQVHGDQMVQSAEQINFGNNVEADALFTNMANRAVTVMTADCLPVLILSPKTVVAIHAGWRGVKNEIILKSLQNFGADFCGNEKTVAVIGPHIQSGSFEVDKPLAEEFQQQYQVYRIADMEIGGESHVILPHASRPQDKAYVDLKAIAMIQLQLAGFTPDRIHTLDVDTVVDARFASYRRDKGNNVGRNFSFASRF